MPTLVLLSLLMASGCARAEAQAPTAAAASDVSTVRPWRNDPRFQRIATALAATKAIDNHTHLVERRPFLPELETEVPVLLRAGNPGTVSVLKSRLGIDWDPKQAEALDKQGRERREALVREAGGESAYWTEHLDLAGVDLALVNQEWPLTQGNDRLKWVPNATTLLYPVDSRQVEARNPGVASDVKVARERDRHGVARLGQVPRSILGVDPEGVR